MTWKDYPLGASSTTSACQTLFISTRFTLSRLIRFNGLTGTPGNEIGLDLGENRSSLVLTGDLLDAADQYVQLAGLAGAELLDGGHLFLGADDTGDGPGTLEEERRQQLGDLAVASDKKNVMSHDDAVCMLWVEAMPSASMSCGLVGLITRRVEYLLGCSSYQEKLLGKVKWFGYLMLCARSVWLVISNQSCHAIM